MERQKLKSIFGWIVLILIGVELCLWGALLSLADFAIGFTGSKSPELKMDWILLSCAMFALALSRVSALPLVVVALAQYVEGFVVRTQLRGQSPLEALVNGLAWEGTFVALAVLYLFLSQKIWPFKRDVVN